MKSLATLFIAIFVLTGIQIVQGAAKKSVGDYLPTEQIVNQTIRYSGNVKSQKFHQPGCKHYYCKTCTRYFNTIQEAEAAGYTKCGWCFK